MSRRKPRPPIADGTGKWVRHEIARRYEAHCRRLGQKPSIPNLELAAAAYGERPWIVPLINKIIEGIRRGDRGCMEIGIELIEEDAKFAFGKLMKANTANALRKANLSEDQKNRVRARVTSLLLRGLVPHEMRQYARLMKRIGLGAQEQPLRDELQRLATADGKADPYVLRFLQYLIDPKMGPWAYTGDKEPP